MQKKITQDDIVLYIYNELEETLRPQVELAIASDPELLAFFQETMLLVSELNSVREEPAGTVLKILSEESRSNSLEIH